MIADLWETIRVAWDGLFANKLRSGLTMLGVIIGVAAVVALLSIGQGAQAAVTSQITSVGTNLLFVMPGAIRTGGVQTAGAGSLTMADAEAIADPTSVPDAAIVAPEFSRSTQIIFGDTNINAEVMGVTPDYISAFGLQVAQGQFVGQQDVDGRTMVAVLGATAAQDLFGDSSPVGQTIKVAIPGVSGGRVSLTVVGVLASKGGSRLGNADDSVLVPISTAQIKIMNGRDSRGDLIVTRINVVAASKDQTQAASDEINALLLQRHHIATGGEADFSVLNQADLLNTANQVTTILTVFLGAIAAISLLVGGIGIMNIMLVSVTERTREIGIRKAVGARRADVLTQFLLEAVVLSLLGGLIGILVGAGIAALVNLSGVLEAVVSVTSVLLAVGFSLAVGVFFGIYPANRAAGLEPIEALRYE